MGFEPRCGHPQFLHYMKYFNEGDRIRIIPCKPGASGYENIKRAEREFEPGYCKIGLLELNRDITSDIKDWDKITVETIQRIPFSEEEPKKCGILEQRLRNAFF